MTAYYNENEPRAAAWLRELIKQKLIAPGDVDERSIEDVLPTDLAGYTQCHFFAGIGGWSLALRLAGWPDDKPAWTGSCPCQPFSASGQRKGFDDERHLWPDWHWLIQQCEPAVLFGEQVASGDALPWIDLVSTDMEALGYAFGSLAIPACGIGAPQIRTRAWFVAHTAGERCGEAGRYQHGSAQRVAELGATCGLDYANGSRFQGGPEGGSKAGECASIPGIPGSMANSGGHRLQKPAGQNGQQNTSRSAQSGVDPAGAREDDWPGPTNGQWRDADWIRCRDGKWRPVQPGLEPLANGFPERVGLLRGYGNAIVPQEAAEFITAAWETINE